ncbi:MAG: sugar phosphate isomerase/epimerase [Sphaerochaetaceae bacterium]|jgi:sugar phosphate isomerase/epimerase|nr:sugar phosphate isomerase/epimerase [Sphaerochaetaceae bacterium]
MKLGAIVLTPEVPSDSNMMAFTGSLNKILPILKGYGYSGVEFITVDPKQIDVAEIKHLLARYELEPIAINTGPLNKLYGYSLTDPDPEKRSSAISRMKEILNFAANWNIPVNCGILRGQFLPRVPQELTVSLLIQSLKELCDFASQFETKILIETVPFMMTNFINTLAEAETLINSVSCSNLGLMYDIFNMYIEEKDLLASIHKYSKSCHHIHFADSNRLAPGDGGMDYGKIIKALHEVNYHKYCVVELRPHPNQEIVTKRAADYLLPLLL